ncbi:MAG: hypothetical protein OCD76_06760, partial [Reichenbachiella sp.]
FHHTFFISCEKSEIFPGLPESRKAKSTTKPPLDIDHVVERYSITNHLITFPLEQTFTIP